MLQHWSELFSPQLPSLLNWGLHIFSSEVIQNPLCAAKSAMPTQATQPTDATTATATGTDRAEPTEAAAAEAGVAELARCV